MTLGQALKKRREAQDFKSGWVAEACSITPTAMSRIELDQALPRFGTLCALAIFYGVTLSELLEGVDAHETLGG
jgi:transcriptional regulator with XRE-family HTH domain